MNAWLFKGITVQEGFWATRLSDPAAEAKRLQLQHDGRDR